MGLTLPRELMAGLMELRAAGGEEGTVFISIATGEFLVLQWTA